MYQPFDSFYIITQYFANEFPDPVTKLPYYLSNYKMVGHNGLDLIPHDIKFDRKLYNVLDGVVMFAGWDTAYGKRIKIWNKELKICHYYCHLDAIASDIKVGFEIKGRKLLGIIGNTGKSMGIHLHFEIRQVDENCNKINTMRNDKDCILGFIDPLPYLPKQDKE